MEGKGVEFETQQARKETEEEKLEMKRKKERRLGNHSQIWMHITTLGICLKVQVPGPIPSPILSAAVESNESQNRKLSLHDDAQSGLGTSEPRAKGKRAKQQGAGGSRTGECTDPGGGLWCGPR